MSFDSASIFPSRLVVASVVAALGSGLLGLVGGFLEVMQYPMWELALQLGFFGGLLAAILGVTAGAKAVWRYSPQGARLDGEEGTGSSSAIRSALITATVAVAGGSGLLGMAGEFLKFVKAPYWELLLQLASVGLLLAVLLGTGAGVQAVWQYVRRPTDLADAG